VSDQEQSKAGWRKARACTPGNCVEVAFGDGVVFVRSSRDPSREPLEFNLQEWAAFLAGVREHEFDIPATEAGVTV
jgi:Domain of unknown function (DUF397)